MDAAPGFDSRAVRTPCYVIDLERIERNLALLGEVQRSSGARILLALKGFGAWSVFPLVDRYLSGYSASGLFEAKVAHEFGAGMLHVYSPAYTPDDFGATAAIADHIVFNSMAEWERYRDCTGGARVGLRVNPEHSEVANRLYDPAAPGSRLGITVSRFPEILPEGITGLHFHTLCELNSDALARTLEVFERKFAHVLPGVRWVNFGGGHHITRSDYDRELLVCSIRQFRERWGVDVFLEPGEAIALNAGYLVASVLDVVTNGVQTAILDASATAHMPDVLEMPYRPRVFGARAPGELRHTYRLAGNTCLAGDIIGDYSFDEPLSAGGRLVFADMAHYTMVKNTLFNGVRLPSIVLFDRASGKLDVQKAFGYETYRDRLS